MNSQSESQSYPQPPEQPQNNSGKKNSNTWVYLAIIALLLGVNGYLFFNRTKLNKEKEFAELGMAKADSSRSVIQQDYDAALARLDELISDNKALDSLVNNNNSEISRLKSQIDKIVADKNASAADLKRAHGLIKQLESKVVKYEERIATLEGENKQLTQANLTITHERDSFVTESTNLRKLGAVLVATNIRMSPIDQRKNDKERETGRAKRVDIMRIVFDIVENRVAESGPKEVFFRVLGPDGNLLSNASFGSGATTDSKGESLPYTFSKQINLQTGEPVKNVTADWKQDNSYVKGNYIIEIYNGGYMIGSGGVTLK